MTCIIGTADAAGHIWVGADRAATWGGHTMSPNVSKLAHHGDWVVGVSGRGIGPAVLMAWPWHKMPLLGTHKWWLDQLPQVLETLKRYNERPDDDGTWDLSAVVASRAEIFLLDGGLVLTGIGRHSIAVGGGGKYAEGALSVQAWSPQPMVDRVTKALRAASAYNSNGAPPYDIWQITAAGIKKYLVRK